MATPLTPVTAGFRRLAQLRHARGFHPDGRVGHGLLVVSDPDSAIGRVVGAADHAVTVRLSRGVGLPGRLADFLGLAVRIERGEEPIDLLFTTTGDGRWGRRLILPSTRWTARSFSTVMPYAADDPHTGEHEHTLIALTPTEDSLPDASLEALDHVDAEHPLTFAVEESHGGWHSVGRLIVHEVGADESLPFDPMLHADPHLHPVRFLSGVREAAYRGSRRGR
ncbi:MAG: hypothetical protein ACXVDH_08955 [Nocardioides sp.]